MKHYVYRLDDPITNEFYIGSRSCKCKIADDGYMGSYRTWKPEDKSRLIKTILKSNFRKRETCIKYEAKIIKENIDDTLNRNYSIPSEGYHTHGMKFSHTIAQNKLKSERMMNRVVSESTREKIGNSKIGIPRTLETKNKISKSSKGRIPWISGKHHTKEVIDKMKRAVIQYTMDGTYIKEYISHADASFNTHICVSSISSACSKRYNSAGGYIWEFKK